jgi:GNAT superfamily N-acetyltransferase
MSRPTPQVDPGYGRRVPTVVRPMTDEELAAWLPRMRKAYADDMVQNAGADFERARAKAEADVERLFPDGVRSAEQLVYAIESDGEYVGELWLAEQDAPFRRVLWIYDVHVDDTHRGQGHGRAAMLFAEDEARRLGLPSVALNVFGGNEVARGLYRSLGYVEEAVYMTKLV